LIEEVRLSQDSAMQVLEVMGVSSMARMLL
jgi:hypothetical protein